MKLVATWIFSLASAVVSLLGVLGLADSAALMGGRYGVVVFLVALGALSWVGRQGLPDEESAEPVPLPQFRYAWALALAALVALAITAGSMEKFDLPHGDWDAWSIWNLRARFLADPDSWRHAISPLLFRSHPDYPLLTSTLSADFVKFNASPAALAIIFFAAVPVVLISTLVLLRGAASGWLACFALVASAGYITQAPSQYADIPLSAFMLGALASLWQPKHPFMLFGAGLMGGCAAFTKNEGIVFGLGLLAAVAWFWRAALLPVLCGALPGLAITGWFKFFFAPASEYSGQSYAKLLDPSRWMAILTQFGNEVWHLGIGIGHPVLILVVLGAGLRFGMRGRIWKIAAVVLGCQTLGYFGAYLLTPNDLQWQLSTSMNRLVAQVWPSALLLFFMALKPPEYQTGNSETASRPPRAGGSRARRHGG